MSSESQSELFAHGPAAPVDVAPQAERWRDLAARIPAGVRFGTSSWSFPGWAGLVYDREVPPSILARDGLAAYARHPLLRAVGVDRSYYEAPSEAVFRRYAQQVPDDFRFMVKMQRDLVTLGHPQFLDAQWARECVLGPTFAGLGPKLGTLLLQFPPMTAREIEGHLGGPRRFAEQLYRFLRDVGGDGGGNSSIAVELRAPELLTEDYMQALRHGGATHAYVVHPRMLPLAEQVERVAGAGGVGMGGGRDPALIRWMLAPGASYQATRDAWSPFNRIQRDDEANRAAIVELVRRLVGASAEDDAGGTGSEGAACKVLAADAIVIVNNKAEGSSPLSVQALASELARVLTDV